MTSPYTHFVIDSTNYGCYFCGCVVHSSFWDDHVNWHETLDMQATAVMRRSLQEIEDDLQ